MPPAQRAIIQSGIAVSSSIANVELGYAEKNDVNAFTTVVDYPAFTPVTGLLLAFTAPARPYNVTLIGNMDNDTLNDYGLLILQESLDNGGTWTTIQYGAKRTAVVGDGARGITTFRRRFPAAGTLVQYRAAISRIGGGIATLAMDTTAAFPALATLNAIQV